MDDDDGKSGGEVKRKEVCQASICGAVLIEAEANVDVRLKTFKDKVGKKGSIFRNWGRLERNYGYKVRVLKIS